MAGDISRSSFQRAKHNSSVRMQQGRVQLDADWNEQLDIEAHLDRTFNIDVAGVAAAPADNAGFGIGLSGGDLSAGLGRMYVAGLLCENEADVVIADLNDAVLPPQPDLPGYGLPTAPGEYLAYLDVWEREITALEDPSIREIALGGPDTTTRKRVVWQVKLASQSSLTCTTDVSSLLPPASSGQMMAQAASGQAANSPCVVAATAGYRSLENQLYRVEIHTGGTAGPVGNATFKWSRDNGSVVTAWQGQGAAVTQLAVSTLGKDDVLNFAAGQWVELLDDVHELNGQPGVMAQLSNAQLLAGVPTLTVSTATGSTTFTDYSGTPKVRRWDHTATSSATGAVQLTEAAWIDLEDGVQVWFKAGGYYNTGDYWLVPARTATTASQPALLWPTDALNNPLAQPPNGIVHNYAPLAVLTLNANLSWAVYSDCRSFFSPISAQLQNVTEVASVETIEDGVPISSGTLLTPDELLTGLNVVCTHVLDASSLNAGTLAVSVDVPPWDAEVSSTPSQLPAAYAVKIMANYAVSADGFTASWIPLPSARAYFYNELANLGVQTLGTGEALVRLTLRTDAVRQGFVNASAGDGDANALFTLSAWVGSYCDKTDLTNYVPFEYTAPNAITNAQQTIIGPDASGDYVVVGTMYAQAFEQMLAMPLPSVSGRQLFCQPLTVWPGLQVYAYVPSAAERQGDFSSFLLPLLNPRVNQDFPNNQIAQTWWPIDENGVAIAGVFAWRFRAYYTPYSPYYGYGYGYGANAAIGAELI